MVPDTSIGVMIVDDEAIIRKGLMGTIPWGKYGMHVAADAPNGKKAWDAFLEGKPEVVITDIVMPEVGGIELAKKIKEHAPMTKILLLSCHSDFEYVQQGIKLGASGYVLKTSYNDDELEQFLRQFQAEIREYRLQARAEIRKRFLEWLFGIDDWLAGSSVFAGEWRWVRGASAVFLAAGAAPEAGCRLEELYGQPASEVIKVGGDRYFVFVPAEDAGSLEKKLTDMKGKFPHCAGSKKDRCKGFSRGSTR
ncbi:response regulator [Gordoniibacillus kamchatkensis]|uniref:response regulator n=1 Tax=Gordoniibacillus kamchatkensis TaxID=1590651 RepID=UPI0006972B92|nr:response regulator [Paenibacillus sp. VKM B-2647]